LWLLKAVNFRCSGSLSAGRAVFKEVCVLLRLQAIPVERVSSSHALQKGYSGGWHANPAGQGRLGQRYIARRKFEV
jgi:hypothetical protein